MKSERFDQMLQTLKRAAAALRDAGIPFAVGGGIATFARGGPPSFHDIDVMVLEHDAEKALAVLEDAGMRGERPPEGWLLKAFDGDVMIDLIFRPAGLPVDDQILERAEVMDVEAMPMPVLSAEDVLVTKLLSLSERNLDYPGILDVARPLREQIDWSSARRRTEHSPFARAFFTLGEGLGVIPPAAS